MKIKTRTWVLLIAGLLAASIAAAWYVRTQAAPGRVANIYVDGECVKSIQLDRVTRTETFTVQGPAGENHILVEPGRICVESADCPDQICVQQGWLTNQQEPIVCLPNHLVIQLEETEKSSGWDIDAVIK